MNTQCIPQCLEHGDHAIVEWMNTASYFLHFYLFIYFWLHWVFVAAHGLSPVVVNGGFSLLQRLDFSLWWLLLFQSMDSIGLSSCGSWGLEHGVSSVAHGLCCSEAYGIFLGQGSNLYPLHWQADSQPLDHQETPCYLVPNTSTDSQLTTSQNNWFYLWTTLFKTTKIKLVLPKHSFVLIFTPLVCYRMIIIPSYTCSVHRSSIQRLLSWNIKPCRQNWVWDLPYSTAALGWRILVSFWEGQRSCLSCLLFLYSQCPAQWLGRCLVNICWINEWI